MLSTCFQSQGLELLVYMPGMSYLFDGHQALQQLLTSFPSQEHFPCIVTISWRIRYGLCDSTGRNVDPVPPKLYPMHLVFCRFCFLSFCCNKTWRAVKTIITPSQACVFSQQITKLENGAGNPQYIFLLTLLMRENIVNTIKSAMFMLPLFDPLVKALYYYFIPIILFCNISSKPNSITCKILNQSKAGQTYKPLGKLVCCNQQRNTFQAGQNKRRLTTKPGYLENIKILGTNLKESHHFPQL